MSVFQVEEYYLFLNELDLSDDQVAEITEYISSECYSDFEFQNNNTELVVSGIPTKFEGESLEEGIMNFI